MTQQPGASKPNPRIAVSQPAVLTDMQGSQIACTVIDVSKDGFRLKVPRVLPPGADYTLEVGKETHRIEIRWASPGEVGGLFLEKLA